MKRSYLGAVMAAIAIVTALCSVVDVSTKALHRHLVKVREARAKGVSLRAALARQIDNVRSWLRVGAGWLDAFSVGARRPYMALAGGVGSNVRPSDAITLLDRLPPVSQGAATVTTGWIDVSKFEALMAVIQTGVLGASATLDAKFEQATSAAGAGAKDVTGSAITQLVKASNDNNEVIMSVQDEQLDSAGGFRWVRLSVTVGTAASLIAAVVYGVGARYAPETHKATVVQVKQVRN